jgi:Fic family protein
MKKIRPVPETMTGALEPKGVSEKELRSAKEFNDRYLHYDELRYRTANDEERERIWAIMKIARTFNEKRFTLNGVDYRYTVTPNLSEDLILLGKRLTDPFEHCGKEAGESRMRYYSVAPFMEEAISSSILEGAAVTRKDAKTMIRKKIRPVTNGQRMVMNNYEVMENIKRIKDAELTPDTIKEMHRTIVKGTLDGGEEWEGRFREDDETVVGDLYDAEKVYHVPPKFKDVPGMINGLCEFANGQQEGYMHPIVKAVILHYMIGYIHPFTDGNGRLARSLFYWYSMKNGYWIMEYATISKEIKNSKGRYGLAYQYSETDANDLTYFIKYNMDCISKALDSLEEHVERKVLEKKDARKFAEQNPDLSVRQAVIIRDYAGEDHFSVMELRDRYRTAYQTMRLDVLDLMEKGLVRTVGKERKKILYAVDPGRMSGRNTQ